MFPIWLSSGRGNAQRKHKHNKQTIRNRVGTRQKGVSAEMMENVKIYTTYSLEGFDVRFYGTSGRGGTIEKTLKF